MLFVFNLWLPTYFNNGDYSKSSIGIKNNLKKIIYGNGVC